MSVTTGEHERPQTLTIDRQTYQVEKIEDDWVIEDEWWRLPIHRVYYDVWLLSGARRTVFHDLIGDQWYLQDDPYPLADSPHSTR